MGADTAGKQARETKRAASTQELMSNIMSPGAGEISKAREKQLQDAINRGRGVEFLPGKAPVVEGLTQKGGKPVYNTNAKATDYTGRIVSPAPTLGEMMGDMTRAVFGGQAKEPEYLKNMSSAPGTTTKNYMQYASKPEKVKGIIPSIIEKGTPGMMFIKALSEAIKPKKKTVDTKIGSSLLGGDKTGSTDSILGNSVIK